MAHRPTATLRRAFGDSGRDRSAATKGFTLLEMILVLAVAALMMGVAAAAMTRAATPGAEAKRGMSALVSRLRSVRADAMMTRSRIGFEFEPTAAGEGVARWSEPGGVAFDGGSTELEIGVLSPMDDAGAWAERVAVRFDASGRSDTRRWRFAERSGADTGRIAWTIEFDPVSGVARLIEGDGAAGVGRGGANR